MLHKTLIFLVLDYCDFIYHGTSATNKETLQKLQNCTFRSILAVDLYAHTLEKHAFLIMDTLEDRRKKHISVQMYKFLNELGPPACRDMFTLVSDYHEVHTRSSVKLDLIIPKLNLALDLIIPKLNLALAQRNIRCIGVKIWKEIPENIKAIPMLDAFKWAIHSDLL